MSTKPAHHELKALTFKPHMDPPQGRAIWPPPGFRATFDVSKGNLDWHLVASIHAVLDAKDLIYFNFRTTSPREINWYLRHYLGCYQSTDGKNFIFEDAKPGILFIPPAGWTRTDAVHAIEKKALEFLKKCLPYFPHVVRKRFSITQLGLEWFIADIENGQWDIQHDPALSDAGQTHARKRIIYIKNSRIDYWDTRITLIHEVVHAIFHNTLLRTGIKDLDRLDNEFLAWLIPALVMFKMFPTLALDRAKYAYGGHNSSSKAWTLRAAYYLAYFMNQDNRLTYIVEDYDRKFPNELEDTLEPDERFYPELFNPVKMLESAILLTPHPAYMFSKGIREHPRGNRRPR